MAVSDENLAQRLRGKFRKAKDWYLFSAQRLLEEERKQGIEHRPGGLKLVAINASLAVVGRLPEMQLDYIPLPPGKKPPHN